MKYSILLLVGFALGPFSARADYDIAVTGTSSGSVWGSSPYTDDSSFAKAAVHAGLIAIGQTATIRVHPVGSVGSYAGSTANGVTTASWGSPWNGVTLSVVQAPVPPTVSLVTPSSVNTNQSFNVTVSAADTNGDLSSMGLRHENVGQIAWWGNGQIGGSSAAKVHAVSPITSASQARFRGEVFDAAGNGTTGSWYSVQVNAPSTNQPPQASFSGSTQLSIPTNPTGTWTYSASDNNLLRWRVSLLPATAAWTSISTGQATSFSHTFSSAGTYTWRFEVQDTDLATATIERTVVVAGAPTSLPYTVSSSYSSFTSYPQGAPSYPYLVDGLHNSNYGYASDTGAYNWLKADLGGPRLVQSVTLGGGNIAGWGAASSYSAGAVLEYSTDNVTWTPAHTFSGGFAPGDNVVTPNITARYWRIARNSWLATTEFRFAGTTPVPGITSALTASGTTGASFSYQITATNSPTSYGATGLPPGLSINTSTGLIFGTPTTAGTSNLTLTAVNGSGSSSPTTLALTVAGSGSTVGQVAYTAAGSHTWIAPAGVTVVSVVAVGGGAGGGGGGGALAWKNNITVVPGTGYPVVVGAGGAPNSPGGYDGGNGGNSSFSAGFGTMTAGGGRAQGTVLGGVRGGVYDGGGDGGKGTDRTIGGYAGGGAGGYSGNGGMSEFPWYTWGGGQPGAGGGGAGGAYPHGAGGGVGILGAGPSGASGGLGGSGGANGATYAVGGAYGGGGAGWTGVSGQGGRAGGSGAVRIIWGTGRTFPSANTGDAGPPVITGQPTNLAAPNGSSAVFSVTATGMPTPLSYQWRKNGVSLSNGGHVIGATSATLTLGNVQPIDAATYSVVVTNSAGAIISTGATLSTYSPPPAPVAHAPTHVTTSGLTANWAAVSGATRYYLDVSTTPSFSSFVAGFQNLDVGSVIAKPIAGLSTNGTYHYRVRAEVGGYSSGNSNVVTATIPRTTSVSWFDVDGDGIKDEVSANGANGYSYAIDNIWLEAVETDQYVLSFNAWFDFHWPDGFFVPDFGYTWSVVPSIGGYQPRLTHFHSFTAEPGYRYEIWGSRNGGGMWLKLWGPITLSVGDNLDVGYLSGWFHPDDYLSSLFYLVRINQPIGNVSIAGLGTTNLGTSKGGGGLLSVALPSAGVTVSVKDAIGQLLKAGPSIAHEVWDGASQIRVGNTSLGGLVDLGIDRTGQFSIGLKLDDSHTVWFNLHVSPSVPPQLGVDANRDGAITFDAADATSAAQPFRFWLNDDLDRLTNTLGQPGGEVAQDDVDNFSSGGKDSDDETIPLERDLEDHARLWIKANRVADVIQSGQRRFGLRWLETSGSPAIRLHRSVELGGGTGYLTTLAVAQTQVFDQGPNAAGRVVRATNASIGTVTTVIDKFATYALPADFFTNASASAYFIFEGVTAGSGRLQLVVLTPNPGSPYYVVEQEGPSVWIDLRPSHQFVERWSCEPINFAPLGPVTNWVRLNSKSGPSSPPMSDADKDYVLYVHGYNLDEYEKQRWLETAFKRLWHSGFKGRVGALTWPTADNPAYFDASEQRAWESGPQLRTLLASLKAGGFKVYVLGHSLGNVVVGEALRDAGQGSAIAASYVASQAAMGTHMYDPTAPTRTDVVFGTPDVYSRFWTQGQDALRPALWTSNVPSYLAPARVSGAVGKFVNFFNPLDYALTGNGSDPANVYGGGVNIGWLTDQRLKPNVGFGYTSAGGFYRLLDSTPIEMTFPESRFAIFCYAAQARSFALGASVNVGGVFSNSQVNLSEQLFGFGSHHIYHSGQFRSNLSETITYWTRLLIELGLKAPE